MMGFEEGQSYDEVWEGTGLWWGCGVTEVY